jgi:photosystem II stability/assembly factor-like uncharacterized protein
MKGGMMRFKITFALLAIVLTFAYLSADWTLQHTGTGTLYGVAFSNGTVSPGLAVGANSLIITTRDTGNTWTQSISAPTSGNFRAISFPDPTHAFIACDSGNVLRSINGIRNWQKINLGTTQNLYGISFPGRNELGYVVGNSGTIMKTTNAGDSWVSIPPPLSFDVRGVFFLSADTGWIVGSGGRVFKTVTGGDWSSQASGSDQLYGVCASTNLNVFAVGEHNTIMKSINGGAQWYDQNSGFPPTTTIYAISFPHGDSFGFVCGSSGWVAKTTNGGTTWDATQLTPPVNLYAMNFPANIHFGCVGGDSEAIFRTADSGHAIAETNPEPERAGTIIACEPNPFRSNTVIKLAGRLNTNATLKVYDCAGGLVRNLALNPSGIANWNRRNELNQKVTPGVYILEFRNNEGLNQRLKLVVLE